MFIDPEASTGARSVSVQTVGGGASGNQTFTVSNAGVDVVTLATDSTPGATPGACPAGNSGDLRFALCHASSGDTIVFDTTAMCAGGTPCTILLGAPLPPIIQAQTVDGGIFGRVAIDGAAAYRVFFVDTGTVNISNMQIQNALAHGGVGGLSSGGGGLGAGGGLFVNQAGAAVTVSGVYFQNCGVTGGAETREPAAPVVVAAVD